MDGAERIRTSRRRSSRRRHRSCDREKRRSPYPEPKIKKDYRDPYRTYPKRYYDVGDKNRPYGHDDRGDKKAIQAREDERREEMLKNRERRK